MKFYILIIVVCIFLYRKWVLNQTESFITNDNIQSIKKLSKVYANFHKTYPTVTIIQTLKVENDVYTILTYEKSTNITRIFQLKGNVIKFIKTPFLLNEFDNTLNTLERSKELTTFVRFNKSY